MRDPLRQRVPPRRVPGRLAQVGHDVDHLVVVHPIAPGSLAVKDSLGRRTDVRPQRPVQHLGHPGVTLDPLGLHCVHRRGRPADQLLDDDLPYVDLAERGQDLADVRQERAVRPDDHDTAATQPLPFGVEQVRHAVQADGRLPGAGRTLHADGRMQCRADQVVLLRLDRGDDVAHRPGARPLDLGAQERVGLIGLDRPDQRLVLEAGQLRVIGEAVAAAHQDPLPVAAGRPVERHRDRRPPVDHQRYAAAVVHVPATDVDLVQVLDRPGLVVDAAEEQRHVGEIEQGLRAHLLGPLVGLVGEAFVVVLAADQRDVAGLHLLVHPGERGAGRGEEGAFGVEFWFGHRREPRIVESFGWGRSAGSRPGAQPSGSIRSRKTGRGRYQRPRQPATEYPADGRNATHGPLYDRQVVAGFGRDQVHDVGLIAARLGSGPRPPFPRCRSASTGSPTWVRERSQRAQSGIGVRGVGGAFRGTVRDRTATLRFTYCPGARRTCRRPNSQCAGLPGHRSDAALDRRPDRSGDGDLVRRRHLARPGRRLATRLLRGARST